MKTDKKCAVVTYISTANFVDCARVLAYSVQKTTDAQFVLAITSNVDMKQREQLSMRFPKGVKIETWEPYVVFKREAGEFQ